MLLKRRDCSLTPARQTSRLFVLLHRGYKKLSIRPLAHAVELKETNGSIKSILDLIGYERY